MLDHPWILASRPKTLCAAFAPVIVGSALAYQSATHFSWEISLYALLVAIFLQIGTNLVNDALDFKKGADNSDRLGPVRVTQSGLLTSQQVLSGGMMCFALAALFGIPLIYSGGWPIALILALSLACGYAYTGGPMPLAYAGLGDLFVIVFFGFVATMSIFYLQTGMVNLHSAIAGAQVGLLSTVMIAINNLRDVFTDPRASKLTLPVRFGITFGRYEIAALILGAYLLNLYWFFAEKYLAGALPFLMLPLGVKVIRNVWNHEPGKCYNDFLANAAAHHLLFSALLAIALFFE